MKPALTYNWTESLSRWSQIPNGEELKHIQNEIISRRLKLSFGHHLMNLGYLAGALDTQACLIKHEINIAHNSINTHTADLHTADLHKKDTNDELGSNTIGLIAEYDQLPIFTNSVDAVVMNHELEFASDPHQVLREIHRVLMPNGNLVLSVFNPVSLFLFDKIWPFKVESPLWHARMFSIARIKDWLVLLGFEIVEQDYCCYSSLLSTKKQADNWMQTALKTYLPKVGSVCIITAKKREWPLTPIRPKIKFKSSFQPVVSRVSSRSNQAKSSDITLNK